MKNRSDPEEHRQHASDPRPHWGRVSRRAFLGLTGAALLSACGASPTLTPAPTAPGSAPTPARVLLPTGRVEPENAARLTLLGVLKTNTSPVRGVAWSPDSSILALSAYRDAQLWDVASGQRLTTLQGHTDEIDGIAWSPDGRLLATASRDTTVRLWDARQHTALSVLQSAANRAPMISVAWSPDSRRLASGDGNGLVQLWDASTGKNLAAWNDPPLQGAPSRFLANAVYGLGWSPDGQRVAANRYDDLLRVWDARTGNSIAIRQTLSGPNGLAWSPDGRLLSVGTDARAIQLWDTRTWKTTATLLQPGDIDGWTYAVPWSPDGRLLAASREKALVQVWNPNTGQQLASLPGHTGPIWAAVWSPDGLRLASGSDDGTARLWGVR